MFDSRNQKPNDHIPILDPVTTSDYTYNNTYQLSNFAPTNNVEGGVQFRVQEPKHPLTTMSNSRNQKPNGHIPILDPVTSSDYTYNNTYNNAYQLSSFAPTNDVGGEVQFRVQEMSQQHVDYGDDDESGVSSPPLWKNSPSRSHFHSFHNSIYHRSISPSSRALAIAKGQWELMEMVKNMPESCYELSLKDLVENNSILESDQEQCLINKEEESFTSTTDQEKVVKQRVKSIKRQESSSKNKEGIKGKMMRNESFEDKGFFLKTFFPIPESKKKQMTKNSTKKSGIKVSPRPTEGSDRRSLEKDWWKKRFSCSSESDSSKTGSSNSESTTGRSGSSGSNDSRTSTDRRKKGFLTNFWSKTCFSKSKSAE